MLNGLSWPATERLSYPLGETVRCRVINLSSQSHPMHLHGFYFDVNALGDGLHDRQIDPARRVVTQLLPPGGTMAMTWTPERAGNWLFHCHIMHHVSPLRRLTNVADRPADHHSSAGMTGRILGVTIVRSAERGAVEERKPVAESPRKLTLVMQPGSAPRYRAS